MGLMVEWIAGAVDRLTAIFPRLYRIPPTHGGVIWPRCDPERARALEPGWGIYWPLVSEMDQIDTRWVSTLGFCQTITLQDRISVTARGLIVWRVLDPLSAIGDHQDVQDRVSELSMACVASVLSASSSEVLSDLGSLNEALTKEARRSTGELGVEVSEVRLTEVAVCRVYRLINGD